MEELPAIQAWSANCQRDHKAVLTWHFAVCFQGKNSRPNANLGCLSLTNGRLIQVKQVFIYKVSYLFEPQAVRLQQAYSTVLRSRLQLAVHVWTAQRASSGKWLKVRFFATKNCTASRLKARKSSLYLSAMCLLHFWTRINDLFLSFGR